MIKRFAPVLVVAIGLLLLIAWLVQSDRAQKQHWADEDAATAEQHFIEQMVQHHHDAIQMAQMAQDRAKVSRVQGVASTIVSTQQKEIDEMKGWYKQWYRKDLPEMADMPGMAEDPSMNMGKLNGASDFDLEFVNQMILHHQKAIQMAKDVLPKAKHKELKDLANSIISNQTKEVSEMRSLQQQLTKFPPGSIGRNDLNKDCDTPSC